MRSPAISIMCLGVLSACGGATTGLTTLSTNFATTPSVPTTPGVPFYSSAIVVATEATLTTNRIDALGLTSPAQFQRSGSASFSGPIVLNDQSIAKTASVAGGITIGIDFADESKASAIAGNFYDLDNTRVSGILSMNGATFSEGIAGGGMAGDLSGTLRNVGRGGRDDDYDYDVSMATFYYGDGVQGLLIIAGGSATEVGATTEIPLSGAATLERD